MHLRNLGLLKLGLRMCWGMSSILASRCRLFSSGSEIDFACSPFHAALMLMRLFGFAPVSLCGFCLAVAACFSMIFSRDLLNLLWYFILWGLVLADVSMGSVAMRMLACESFIRFSQGCKDRKQQRAATSGVPAVVSSWRCLKPFHRQGVEGLSSGFCRIFAPLSHSVRLDVSARGFDRFPGRNFRALDCTPCVRASVQNNDNMADPLDGGV